MRHEIAMGMRNRCADHLEQSQPIGHCQAVPITVPVDWVAFDVLHDDVRQTLGGCGSVGALRLLRSGRWQLDTHAAAPFLGSRARVA
jgi:hypothetical protein